MSSIVTTSFYNPEDVLNFIYIFMFKTLATVLSVLNYS
jgi:hypothetical protein